MVSSERLFSARRPESESTFTSATSADILKRDHKAMFCLVKRAGVRVGDGWRRGSEAGRKFD
jgi:hypothetical protein